MLDNAGSWSHSAIQETNCRISNRYAREASPGKFQSGNGRDKTWYGPGCEKFHVFRFAWWLLSWKSLRCSSEILWNNFGWQSMLPLLWCWTILSQPVLCRQLPIKLQTAITIATICHEAKLQWLAWELEVNPSPLDQVVVTTALRSAGAVHKHSSHINFPRVGFINNHGALRTFARHLSRLDALQAMKVNFQPMPLDDTSVSSWHQNLRIIESLKHHPRLTKEMALELYPPRLHTMKSLLQTVLNVTHWTREAQAQVKRLYSICAVYCTWLVWMEMVAR